MTHCLTEAETALDRRPGSSTTSPSPILPLPPIDAIAEALGVLAAHDNEPAIYADACLHLTTGVSISADGTDRLVDGVLIQRAPPFESRPWPWRCGCSETRCWHGALLEAIFLAWERLGEDPRPLPFEVAV